MEPGERGVRSAAVRGDLDVARRAELARELEALVGARVAVLDLSAVRYADSSALAELVKFRRAFLKAGGEEIRIVAPPLLRRLLEVGGLTTVFTVVDPADAPPAGSSEAV